MPSTHEIQLWLNREMCLDLAVRLGPCLRVSGLVGQGQLQVMGDIQGGQCAGSSFGFSKASLLEQAEGKAGMASWVEGTACGKAQRQQ